MDQQAIGDCLLLATLQAYSQSEDGRQLLRDNIRLNDARDGFIVTLYDNGQPVDVNVTDYYTNGLQGQQTAPPPSSTSTSARTACTSAGRIWRGAENRRRPWSVSPAADRIASTPVAARGRRSGPGGTMTPTATPNGGRSSRPSTTTGRSSPHRPRGGIVSDDSVDADTNNDGAFDAGSGPGAEDQGGGYQIVGNHVYTVESIDDEYVTLINPWGRNNLDAGNNHVGSGGRIRITREEYATYFPSTDVGRTS